MKVWRYVQRLFLGIVLCGSCLFVSCATSIDLTGWPCGINDECGGEHVCNGGVCERTSSDSEAKKPSTFFFMVGASCASLSDCRGRTFVSGKVCKTFGEGNDWPDGYCTRSCSVDKDCNPDQTSANKAFCLKMKSADKKGECRKKCEGSAECKNSYSCEKTSRLGFNACVPG